MDDLSAIEKCQNGDWEAFRFLVERYQARAMEHAVAILGNREDALDAVQDAFVDAFRSLARFDTTRQFYSWFYVLLRHRSFKIAARRKMTETIEETEIIAAQPNLAPEERLTLDAALSALSAEEREIITLKYLDGLSYQEIAEGLGIPHGTVMSRLFHARKQLQARLIGKFH